MLLCYPYPVYVMVVEVVQSFCLKNRDFQVVFWVEAAAMR